MIDPAVLFVLVTAFTGGAAVLLFGPAFRGVAARPAAATSRLTVPAAVRCEEVDAGSGGEPDSAAIHARLYEMALGEAALEPPPADRHRKIAAQIASAVAAVANDPRHAPRRPMLLPQLIRAANDDATSRRELVSIIARDPSLVANLLKLANSALHRLRPEPVESIDGAIALLGTAGIRSLVATAVMQPMFQAGDTRFAGFVEIAWEHTLYSAAATEAHAAFVEKTDRFAGQLLGLLFGLGSIVVFRIAMERYAAMQGLAPHAAVIATAIGRHAPDAAMQIAGSWNVSERLLAALEDQQSSNSAPAATALGRSLHFGRLLGTLALLHSRQAVDEATLKAALSTTDAPTAQVERIWTRLITART